MKKETELILARKENDNGSSRDDTTNSARKALTKQPSGVSANDNIYTDTIKALLEKNRGRVSQYYCANRKCPTTFWEADLGFQCPSCGSYGLISSFKADTAYEPNVDKPVIGYIDSIGRLFCPTCTERFGMGDDVGLVIYNDSEPYCNVACEACRTRLQSTV
jgi:hypothetical protein